MNAIVGISIVLSIVFVVLSFYVNRIAAHLSKQAQKWVKRQKGLLVSKRISLAKHIVGDASFEVVRISKKPSTPIAAVTAVEVNRMADVLRGIKACSLTMVDDAGGVIFNLPHGTPVLAIDNRDGYMLYNRVSGLWESKSTDQVVDALTDLVAVLGTAKKSQPAAAGVDDFSNPNRKPSAAPRTGYAWDWIDAASSWVEVVE